MRIKKLGLLYRGIILLFCAFLLLMAALLGRELLGLGAQERTQALPLLDQDQWRELDQQTQQDWTGAEECLYIRDDSEQSQTYSDVLLPMLEQMKVACRQVRSEEFRRDQLQDVSAVMLAVTDLSPLGDELLELMDWVEDGGGLMIAYLPIANGYWNAIAQTVGILNMADRFSVVTGLHCLRPFMLGGERDYVIDTPYDSSVAMLLDDECEVYMQSTDERPIPLVWRRAVGDGSVVVSNLGYQDKAFWGLYASFYSLLGDGFAWPVINGSAFFLDDFPAPVPSGEDRYITEDYGISVQEFYQRVWWPDVSKLGEKYGLRYTGSVIEDYSNVTEAPFPENYAKSTFQYFGLGVLKSGGEIGLHGYNHMPLVLEGFDYMDRYPTYVPWASMGDMEAGLTELLRFCTDLYPNDKLQVYVPPSNILSPEARAMIGDKFPQIRAIASVYLADEIGYDQDFEVAEDGVVEVPRIISGYQMNDFIYISAFSELNFHYVNSHFQHPDDVMDADRGAELGWEALKGQLDGYMEWLYDAAPSIRNVTASELAAAVQRYDAVTVRRTWQEDRLVLELGNFADEAWLLVRLNGHEPGAVEGGTLEKQLDGLYLLKAESDRVSIELK